MSTVQISVADLACDRWQLHHVEDDDVCCLLDSEPTAMELERPARVVEAVPRPWKGVLSSVDVESGAAKPHHARTQASKPPEREGWEGCGPAANMVGHECDFPRKT